MWGGGLMLVTLRALSTTTTSDSPSALPRLKLLITYFIESKRAGRVVKRFTKTTGRRLGTVPASQGLRNERADIAALGSAHFGVACKTSGG